MLNFYQWITHNESQQQLKDKWFHRLVLKVFPLASHLQWREKEQELQKNLKTVSQKSGLCSSPWPDEKLSFWFFTHFMQHMTASLKQAEKNPRFTLAVLCILGDQTSFNTKEKPISSFLTIQASAVVPSYREKMTSSSCHHYHELICSSSKTAWMGVTSFVNPHEP